MYGYVAQGYWCDVGHLDVPQSLMGSSGKTRLCLQERSPGIWVGQNTHIESSAKIAAPVVIGDNCRMGHGAD